MKRLIFILIPTLVYGAYKPSYKSFNAGELSPMMIARRDYTKYDNGCTTLQNMIPLSQGPAMRRPGTYYVAETKDSSKESRVIPFEYAKTDAYVLEFGDEYMRVFRNGGQVLGKVGTEDISSLDNITAHWTLNDNDASTTVLDDDGGTYNGVATANTETLYSTGKVDGCFDLAGSYAVEIADNAAFSFDDSGTSPFSIVGWIYVDGTDTLQVIASKWKEDTAREWRFSLSQDQKLQFHICDDSINLESSRIAQWKLNENAANTTVLDTDATSHDGLTQVDNTEDLSVAGIISTCLDFGGADAVVITNDHDELSFDDSGDNPFSIAAWIYVTEHTDGQVILSKIDSSNKEWQLFLSASENLIMSVIDQSASEADARIVSDDSLVPGWHHVVGTYGGAGGSTAADDMVLYVDSAVVDSTATTNANYVAMENLTGKVVVGARIASSLELYFQDKIDNVVLFAAELSAANVLNLYNDGIGTESLSVTFPNVVSVDSLSIGWHLVGVTYDGTGGSTAADGMILYVDGAAVDSTAANEENYVAMENTAIKVRIGAQYSSAAALQHTWQDKIDNVAIFSDVLTATEVAGLYSTSAYEISTPYADDEVFDLQYVQIADVMYIAHPNYPPYKLSRALHTNWTIADVNYITGPFITENSTDTTVTPSATTGTITLDASGNIFSSGHVGAIWEIRHPRTDATLSGTLDAVESSSAIDCEGDYKLTTHGTWTGTISLQRSLDGSTWENVPGGTISSVDDDNIVYSGTEPDSGYQYRVSMTARTSGSATYNFLVYDHMHTGVAKIASFVDPNEVTAVVHAELGGTTATTYWSEGYWSDENGWPETIESHEFRLIYGGSSSYPQTIWASKADDYDIMTDGIDDDDALVYLVPGQNPIQWMMSQNYLMIGTLGGAGRFGDPEEEMTPTVQPQYRQQSKYGSDSIQAYFAGDAILYVERGGQKVREFVYNFERDKFVAPDMTVLAEHITGDGIVDIAYQSRPDSVLWCVREDGDIISMAYNREQEVVGWAHHITDGDAESVAVIPGTDEDEVWFIVNRTINGSSVRYVEYMKPRDWGANDNDTYYVDSGLTWDGGDAVDITNVTQADPAVITVSSWPTDADGTSIADGDQVKILTVLGMTELNGNVYTVDDANETDLTFSLNNSADTLDIDSSGYTAYTSGGTAQWVENSFTGYGHLEGETVTILADGEVQASRTISSGAFSNITWANTVHAGMPYTSILETVPIAIEGQGGSTAASRKTISKVAIDFYKSLGTLYGIEDDTDECFTETSLVTGWKILSFQHGYFDDEATVYIEQVDPLPLTVLEIIPTITITER